MIVRKRLCPDPAEEAGSKIQAKPLWNPGRSDDEVAREYFAGAFGEDGGQARQYVGKLSELFAPLCMNREALLGKDGVAKQAVAANLARVTQTVADFRPVIARHMSEGDVAQRQSWKHLSLHADMVLNLAAGVRATVEGNREASDANWKQVIKQVAEQESETDPITCGRLSF